MKTRSYSELRRLYTFEERFEYLKLNGEVGRSTFGFDRYVNQKFYASQEWKSIRSYIIQRDNGCDLGIAGYEIYSDLLIHHINPIAIEDVIQHNEWIFDPDYLILTTHRTHNAIHFGNEKLLPKIVTERLPGDTKLW